MTALITSIMIMLGFVHSSAPAPQQARVPFLSPGENAISRTLLTDSCSKRTAYPLMFEHHEPESLIPGTLLPCK